jgi:poly-gamma-glutamate capsule biosynthesis protein CapA/YwtB (metallophosphatase superfamily)
VGRLLAGIGDVAVVLLLIGALMIGGKISPTPEKSHSPGRVRRETARFLALGDINLGRAAGREIIKGDTLFPFRDVIDTLARYDLVVGNLESCLSDQDGETESPDHNLIFTGPPAGAWSIKRAGIDVVTTANNHALDYGVGGWLETIENLTAAGVRFVGTARDSQALSGPMMVERNGIRFAFLACTGVMNRPGNRWKRYVADADTASLARKIRDVRSEADIVVVSYHGGEEYAPRPARRTIEFGRAMIDAGADLVLGHHPHVPYGIEKRGRGLIVHSLGNFVFRQPARDWTGKSFAFAAGVVKDSAGTRLDWYAIVPLRCGLQPTFDLRGSEADSIRDRVRSLSSLEVTEHIR